jgi:hydrogenase expression/formation protein
VDLEGYVRHRLDLSSDDELAELLASRITEYKSDINHDEARRFGWAVIEEVRQSLHADSDVCTFEPSGVSMGRFGVGSRGTGDMHAHRCIAQIIGDTGATVDATALDDAGVVAGLAGQQVVVTVDGMHSRLSEFPFLAGFHVARAALRDVWVMGARPLAMLADVHVADDGDVARVFDFVAGIAAVGEAVDVPLVTGSTLRIGGDLVLGERLTGCVGAVGQTEHLTARQGLEVGDLLLQTEGAGGGTISTAAIYGGFAEVIDETMNVQFLDACAALSRRPVWQRLHAMTDVTNGGLRGDVHEMAYSTGLGIVVDPARAVALVAPRVLDMLRRLDIDPLGVSVDALLVAGRPDDIQEVGQVLTELGLRWDVVGEVRQQPGVFQRVDGREESFAPKFRESPYTPVKKFVGERTPPDFDEMASLVDGAAQRATDKKQRVIELLRQGRKETSS